MINKKEIILKALDLTPFSMHSLIVYAVYKTEEGAELTKLLSNRDPNQLKNALNDALHFAPWNWDDDIGYPSLTDEEYSDFNHLYEMTEDKSYGVGMSNYFTTHCHHEPKFD